MADTRYSKKIPGDRGNYGLPTTFDIHTGGYVGLTQPSRIVDETLVPEGRVLLSPKQVTALLAFIGARKPRKSPKRSRPAAVRKAR